MSFFKKLFGKSNNNETTVNEIKTPIKTKNEFSPLVLWWINNKKGGYDTAQKKFPSWFANKYSIDFDFEVSQYLKKGFLEYSNSTNVVLNEEGKKELKYYNCIVILHMGYGGRVPKARARRQCYHARNYRQYANEHIVQRRKQRSGNGS